MPTLRISKPFLQYRLFNNNYEAGMSSWTTAHGNTNYGQAALGTIHAGYVLLNIYKGTPETFPSFTDKSTRSSDLLISFSLPASNFVDYVSASATHYRSQVGRHLTNQAAAASGQATWFMLHRAGDNSLTNKGAIIGSIGISGSGADLEIPNINIVSGENYRSNGFYINFPLTFTW